MKRKMFLIIIFLTVLISIGCGSNVDKALLGENPVSVNQESSISNKTLLLFNANEDNEFLGDLYVQKGDEEKEKISSNVVSYNFQLIGSQDAVFFIDSEDNIYFKKNKEEKQLIASDPIINYTILDDETGVFYLTSDTNDLYLRRWGEEKEKIASDVVSYDFRNSGDIIAYIDLENDFYIKTNGEEKEKIASDTGSFILSNNGDICYYNSLDSDLYIRDLSKDENEKIASTGIHDVNISSDGKIATYLGDTNFEKGRGEFYFREFDKSPEKIASDITDFQMSSDGKLLHYLNDEGFLFVLDKSKDDKERISGEVTYFLTSLTGDIVVFEKEDKKLYLYERNKDLEVVSSDIIKWNIIDNDIVYLTKDNHLYLKEYNKEKERLSDDVENYVLADFSKTLTYYKSDFIVYMQDFKEEEMKVLNNANDFTDIWFSNDILFSKTLRINDIQGIWRSDDYQDFFVEIANNGILKFYTEGESKGESSVKLEETSLNSGVLITEEYIDFYGILDDSEPFYISYNNKDSIDIDYLSFTKIDENSFQDELLQQKKNNEAKLELEKKIENATILSNNLIYTYQTIQSENANFREYPNVDSQLLGTLNQFNEFYVNDTSVSETGSIWLNITGIDTNGNHINGWSSYINFE